MSEAEQILAELQSTTLRLELHGESVKLFGGTPQEREYWLGRLRPHKAEIVELLKNAWPPEMVALEERTRPSAEEMRRWQAARRK